MKVIVNKDNRTQFNDFIVVSSFKDVFDIVSDVDTLVIGQAKEGGLEASTMLSELVKLKEISTVIYISKPENIHKKIEVVVLGAGGMVYEDEYFLTSERDLLELIKNESSVNHLLELPGNDLVQAYFQSTEKGTTLSPRVAKHVHKAINGMLSEYQNKNTKVRELTETSLQMFNDIVELAKQSASTLEDLQSQITETIEEQEMLEDNSPTTGGILVYPRVRVAMRQKYILRVKKIGEVSYLTHFMLGFLSYLREVKFLKARLIFVIPRGYREEMYEESGDVITKNNYQTADYTDGDVKFVSHPIKMVLDKMITRYYDYYIFVDLTEHSNEHIVRVNSPNVVACNSNGYLKKEKIRAELLIQSKPTEKGIYLKEIENYSKDSLMRFRQYQQTFQKDYDILMTKAKV